MSTDRHWLAPVITWRSQLVQGSDCSTCKLVALALSLYMNERGGSAFPSMAMLAADCSLTHRAVRKHLNEHLHPQGWLILVERGGQKGLRRRANEWQASTPELGSAVGGRPRNEDAAPRNETASTPERGAPQVVHELDHEIVAVSLVCRECSRSGFKTMDEIQDHQEFQCPALSDPDGSFEKARAELKKAGGRG
jgi:hypothetical protein